MKLLSSTFRPVVLGALATVLALTGCTNEAASTDQAPAAEATPDPVLTTPPVTDDLLFIARATGGSLDLDEDGKGTLKLTSVPTITWFSDRPDHDAGASTTLDTLKEFGWKKNGDSLGEGKMAPNAALVGDTLTDAVVVELLSVSLDGDDLTFTVKAISKVPADQRRVQLGRSELFIDSVQPLAIGNVVGSLNAGLPRVTTPTRGVMVITGDVVLTADGKQAVNLTMRPFWNTNTKYGFDQEKILVTLTEDSPLTPAGLGIPFVSVFYNGIKFVPADPAAGVPIAKLWVYRSGGGYEEVLTSYRP